MIIEFDLYKELERLKSGYTVDINYDQLLEAFNVFYKKYVEYNMLYIISPMHTNKLNIPEMLEIHPKDIVGRFKVLDNTTLDIIFNGDFKNIEYYSMKLMGRWLYSHNNKNLTLISIVLM